MNTWEFPPVQWLGLGAFIAGAPGSISGGGSQDLASHVEACGILAPQQGIEPTPPALEGEVLTTGPPGKSLVLFFNYIFFLRF